MPLSLDGTGSITGISTVSVSDDLSHVGDTNTAIRFPANDTISFETSGSEKLRIQPNGRVGIGTDNPPDCTLTVCEFNSGTEIYDNIALRLQGSTGQNVAIQFTDTTGAAAYIAVQGDALRLGTNNAERLRIDSTGLIHAKTRSAEVRRMILSGSPSNSAFNIEAHDGETGTSSGDVQGKLGLFYNDGSTLNNTACISFERGSGAPDGAMAFVTNQAERLRIDSAGAAFFKGTSDGTKGTINLESTDPFIRLYDTNGANDRRKWDIRNIGASSYEELDFRTINDANNSFNSVMQIEYGGDVNISDGNLRVASGHGIDFSATGDATGNSSELFDDYEEGSWTPTCAETIASITSARYTKIGRMVHYQFYINMGASSSTATFTIAGLPYTTYNGSQYYYGTGRIQNATFVTLQINANSNNGHVYVSGGTTLKFNTASNNYVLISGAYEAYY